jgi:hypothetical protein
VKTKVRDPLFIPSAYRPDLNKSTAANVAYGTSGGKEDIEKSKDSPEKTTKDGAYGAESNADREEAYRARRTIQADDEAYVPA